MADYLSRLVERAIGAVPLARPVIASRFALAPALAADARPGRSFEESEREVSVEVTPRPIPQAPTVERAHTLRRPLEQPDSRAWHTAHPPGPEADEPRGAEEAPGRDRLRPPDEWTSDAAQTRRDTAAAERAMPSEPTRTPVVAVQAAPLQRLESTLEAPVPEAHGGTPTAPAAERRASHAAPPSAPTISVTIGRVDVRAIADAPPLAAPRPRVAPPSLTLDEYLRRRDAGGRR
jgi:hypothetical protein